MNGEIAAILTMDGVASGAIYVLIGLGLVLIFAVTRVIFVPFGDIAAFTALTLASLETGGLPGTVGLVAVLAVLPPRWRALRLVRARALNPAAARFPLLFVLPLVPAAAVWLAGRNDLLHADQNRAVARPGPAHRALARSRRLPADRRCIGPAAAHRRGSPAFCAVGLGLMFFGPEGVRTKP